jgi:DNA polymerase-3 subunit beta
VKRSIETKAPKHSAIVPQKALTELAKFLDASADIVKVRFSENQIFFEKGPTVLVSRLIDGTYPNYEQVIPKKNDQLMVAGADELLKAVRRVGILASEKSSPVKLVLKGSSLTIQSSTPGLQCPLSARLPQGAGQRQGRVPPLIAAQPRAGLASRG